MDATVAGEVGVGAHEPLDLPHVVHRPLGGGGVAVGGGEPLGPGLGQAGASPLSHPAGEGGRQLLVPRAAQQPQLPLERVERRLGQRPLHLDHQPDDHVDVVAQGDVHVDPAAVELGHEEALEATTEGRGVQLMGHRQEGRHRAVGRLCPQPDAHVVLVLPRQQLDQGLAQRRDVGLEQLVPRQHLEQRHQRDLVLAALGHVLQRQDAAQLEPEHGCDDRGLGLGPVAEHAHHPEDPGHPSVGVDPGHVDAVHGNLAVDAAHLGRAGDEQHLVGLVGGGPGPPQGRARTGEDAQGVDDIPVIPVIPVGCPLAVAPGRGQLAAAGQHEVAVEQPLQEVGRLAHLVLGVEEAGVGSGLGGDARHLLPHGPVVAGGGQHVAQHAPDRLHQGGTGARTDAVPQLHLEERLPVGRGAGREDGHQPAVPATPAPVDGVQAADDLVTQPAQLLLDGGHDEPTVLAVDLDHGAGGSPPVQRHVGVDGPNRDLPGRASVHEGEGVGQRGGGPSRVGMLELVGRHPAQQRPGQPLDELVALAARAQRLEDRRQGTLQRRVCRPGWLGPPPVGPFDHGPPVAT